MIQINAVSKKYNMKGGECVTALDSVDMTIARGDFITILGSSGSGKSTLLFTAGGMLTPSGGSVIFDGSDIYAMNAEERAELRRTRIGFVFQTFNLIPYLTCLENVALPAVMTGIKKAQALELAEDLLKNIGLAKRIKHRPAKLSVGERQRTAILRSIINNPDLILADEPTGNLDPENAASVMNIFRDLNSKGRTIVMVTHDHALAENGNRTVRLSKGAVESDALMIPEGEQTI